MTEEEKMLTEENEVIEEMTKEEDEYKGRQWRKMLVGVAFIFVVVVIWYVIDLFVQ
jgi:hypothetical protein